MTGIKFCGLSTEDSVHAALDAGADMIGFNFFEPSPRFVSPQRAAELAEIVRRQVPRTTEIVAVTVDMDDEGLAEIVKVVKPDLLQLHGTESPARVAEVKEKFGLPVMKALGISVRADLDPLPGYKNVVDRFLFDAKPPKDAVLPGGNGAAFDWTLMQGLDLGKPIVLSGGLNQDNVAEAIRMTGPHAVDAASGIESGRGVKDLKKIRAFAVAVKGTGVPDSENEK